MSRGSRVWDNVAFWAAIGFTLLLFVYEEWLWLAQTQYFMGLTLFAPLPLRIIGVMQIVLSLLLVIVVVWASFSTGLFGRFGYFLLFAAIVVVQYGYGKTLNRFLSVRDLHTALASPWQLWQAATAFLPVVIVPPLGLYGLLLWRVPAKRSLGWQGITAVFVLTLLYGLLTFYWDEQHLNINLGNEFYSSSPALSPPALAKTAVAAMWSQAETARLERQTIAYQSSTVPTNNIVYIIDESLRGDHLSVNGYQRSTTPYLEELHAAGVVATWGIAVAAATESLQSNRALLSGIPQLPDPDYLHEQYPTIFQYAKAMGYTTYHVDAQTAHLWNTLSVSDLAYVDHWINTDELGEIDMDSDFRAADHIHAITTQSTGNFILLNKAGTHFHYNEKYPETEMIWTPIPAMGDYSNSEQVTNSYDNAIRYNAEGFWRRLLPDLDRMDETVYLYTADHGETLAENGEWWLHGGNSQQEAQVPIILIGRFLPAVDTQYKATHFNLFPTLLDLMAVPEDVRLHAYPLSLLAATATDSAPRYFLGGDNQVVLFTGEN